MRHRREFRFKAADFSEKRGQQGRRARRINSRGGNVHLEGKKKKERPVERDRTGNPSALEIPRLSLNFAERNGPRDAPRNHVTADRFRSTDNYNGGRPFKALHTVLSIADLKRRRMDVSDFGKPEYGGKHKVGNRRGRHRHRRPEVAGFATRKRERNKPCTAQRNPLEERSTRALNL